MQLQCCSGKQSGAVGHTLKVCLDFSLMPYYCRVGCIVATTGSCCSSSDDAHSGHAGLGTFRVYVKFLCVQGVCFLDPIRALA
jgi:hypothetical protein